MPARVGLLFLALGLPACGSTSSSTPAGGGGRGSVAPCVQGDTRACLGPGQCAGSQLCDQPGHWDSCDCGGLTDGGSGGASSGAGGENGAGGRAVGGAPSTDLPASAYAGEVVGRACTASVDCGAGYECIGPGSTLFVGGGVGHGMCVADCTGDPTLCANQPGTLCLLLSNLSGGPARCVEACQTGPSTTPKCHDRPDVACDDTGGSGLGDGYCTPACRGDYDCPGRRCDLSRGTCVAPQAVAGTAPIGSACDTSQAADDCLGFCVPFAQGQTAGFCTGICTLGEFGCGQSPTGTGPLQTVCLFDGTVGASGDYGDLGLCGSLCDCDADCPASNHCSALSPAQQSSSGRAGYCTSPASSAPHITTCP
ncbi:MAG TPA: hypothetical protein VHE30_01795 [Polyangiaceae bacterium]|nr:hypothetical protein [Polyangiaceae bacterium]